MSVFGGGWLEVRITYGFEKEGVVFGAPYALRDCYVDLSLRRSPQQLVIDTRTADRTVQSTVLVPAKCLLISDKTGPHRLNIKALNDML